MKKLLIILLLSAGFLTGCSEEKKVVPQTFERPLPVVVAEVGKMDVPIYIEAIGHVSAGTSVDIKPQVSGRLIEVNIDGGDDVKTGDVLYRIDPLPFQLALEMQQAQLLKDQVELDFAIKKMERYAKISEKDYVSKMSVEELIKEVGTLKAQIAADQANVSAALKDLGYCDICSPIDGRVNLETVDAGNIVSPSNSAPLATILQISPIDVNFSLPQRDFETLQQLLLEGKRKFRATLPETLREFEGIVDSFDGQFDQKTGSIQIHGEIENKDKILWPGEFVLVKVFIKTLYGAPVVPSSAVQIGQKGPYVYVLKEDRTVEQVMVKVIDQHEDKTVLEDHPGNKVIIDGQVNLRSGAKVIVTNEPTIQQYEAL